MLLKELGLTDHQFAPATIVASGLSLAGLGELGILESLPKGALLTIITLMFGAILYFVKRDYGRINDTLDKNSKTLGEMRKLVEDNHTATLLQLADCVKVKDFGASLDRVHVRIATIDARIIVLETKAGMHDRSTALLAKVDVDDDKTPPAGTKKP